MDIKNYINNGYCVVPQFITSEAASELHAEIYNYSSKHKNINKVFCYPEKMLRYFDIRFYKNNDFKIENFNLGMKLLKIERSYKMREIKKELKIKKIQRIDSYITEVSNNDITKWHCDQSFGGATDPGLYFNGNIEEISTIPLHKFFHHLTDVKTGNGAFSYLPKSHIIGMAIREIINSGKLKYQPFMDLIDSYKIIEKNYRLFIENKYLTEEEVDYFLFNAEKVLNKSLDFSIEVKSGGMIIFNDFGFHQGTAPTINQRLVVRYIY